MENDQDVNETSIKISTLNVNAVEFVPSFVITKTIEDPPPVSAVKATAETPENNGNGEFLVAIIQQFTFSSRDRNVRKKKLPHQKSFTICT